MIVTIIQLCKFTIVKKTSGPARCLNTNPPAFLLQSFLKANFTFSVVRFISLLILLLKFTNFFSKFCFFIFVGCNEENLYTNNIRILDLTTKTSVEAKRMELEISSASAAVLNEEIYVCGGYYLDTEFDLALRFSPKLNTWTNIEPLIQRRSGAATVSLNDFVYVVGGKSARTYLNSCEKYDPLANSWTFVQPLLSPRDFAGAAVVNGKIYVCGGDTSTARTTSSMEIYDPDTNNWTVADHMKVERSRFSLVVCNEKLYAIGGRAANSILSSVEAYDIERNRWDFVESLPTPTFGMNCNVDF